MSYLYREEHDDAMDIYDRFPVLKHIRNEGDPNFDIYWPGVILIALVSASVFV